MIKPVDSHRDLVGLPILKERYGHPSDAESLQSFATLAAYRDGGIEVVQILERATRFDIIIDETM